MSRTKATSDETPSSRPFLTPEGQENYLVSLAYNLVEQRLRDGTASSQETTHFLKRGSAIAKLEVEKLERENELLRAKTEALKSQQRVEELYSEALNAMRRYAGQGGDYDEY